METVISSRITMRLEPELKKWLENEAVRQDRSLSYVAKNAIRTMKQRADSKAQMVQNALTEANIGAFISETSMTSWFESLGTENEKPEPKANIFLENK